MLCLGSTSALSSPFRNDPRHRVHILNPLILPLNIPTRKCFKSKAQQSHFKAVREAESEINASKAALRSGPEPDSTDAALRLRVLGTPGSELPEVPYYWGFK